VQYTSFPCEAIKRKPRQSRQSAFQPYKNNWKLLSAPISDWPQLLRLNGVNRQSSARKEVAEYLMKAKLRPIEETIREPLPQRKEEELSLPDNYCYAGMKKFR